MSLNIGAELCRSETEVAMRAVIDFDQPLHSSPKKAGAELLVLMIHKSVTLLFLRLIFIPRIEADWVTEVNKRILCPGTIDSGCSLNGVKQLHHQKRSFSLFAAVQT